MNQMKLIVLLTACASLSACSMAKFWNGEYSMAATVRKAKRQRAAYYAKETPAQQALRAKNGKICWGLANANYPTTPKSSNDDRHRQVFFYKNCMKKRGSPVFSYGEN